LPVNTTSYVPRVSYLPAIAVRPASLLAVVRGYTASTLTTLTVLHLYSFRFTTGTTYIRAKRLSRDDFSRHPVPSLSRLRL
jgi:hypothetical protein